LRAYKGAFRFVFFTVAKALEMFMQTLVEKAADEAKQRNSQRMTPSHL